jgi:secreted trypsin-like serine protease
MLAHSRQVVIVCLAALATPWLQGCEEDPGERVSGGKPVSTAEWKSRRDFTVFVTNNAGTQCCTGTVAGDVVLTAKHCVEGKRTSDVKVETAYGKHAVKRIEKHSSYDVVLLFLDSKAGTKNTMYLSDRELKADDTVAITGFGTTESKGCGSLNDSGLGDIRVKQCSGFGSEVACASSGSYSRTASCGGDSGGPWWRATKENGPFYIVGVNSFGVNGQCGDRSKETGFVRTSAIQSWIKSKTSAFTWKNEDSWWR